METRTKLTVVLFAWGIIAVLPVVGLFVVPKISAGFLAGMTVSTAFALAASRLGARVLAESVSKRTEEILDLDPSDIDE